MLFALLVYWLGDIRTCTQICWAQTRTIFLFVRSLCVLFRHVFPGLLVERRDNNENIEIFVKLYDVEWSINQTTGTPIDVSMTFFPTRCLYQHVIPQITNHDFISFNVQSLMNRQRILLKMSRRERERGRTGGRGIGGGEQRQQQHENNKKIASDSTTTISSTKYYVYIITIVVRSCFAWNNKSHK